MDDKQQRLTAFLNRHITFPRRWGGVPSYGRSLPAQRPSKQELAQQLLASAEYRALGLGTWLGTPEGEFFTEAVEAVSPPFYRQDEELLVDGLTLAANMQSQNQRAAGALALGVIVLAALLFPRALKAASV
ncbi:MAG: hypothetical protein ACLQK4_12770 [Acidimicrobiales bacterium]|jgi:hypothetical protein